jgi:hypothetical protein
MHFIHDVLRQLKNLWVDAERLSAAVMQSGSSAKKRVASGMTTNDPFSSEFTAVTSGVI